jgi:hypothetical protein
LTHPRLSIRTSLILIALSLSEVFLLGLWLSERDAAMRRPYSVYLEWAASWGGSGIEYPRGLAVYKGEIYAVGSTTSYGSGREDIYILKYSPDGRLLWNRTWGGPSHDFAGDVAASDGGIYIAGLTAVDGRAWAVLLKYDFDGTLCWARLWRGMEGTSGRAVSPDGKGAVYVSGYVGGLPPTPTGPFLLRYGPDGSLEWSWTSGAGGDYCWALSVDGGIYLGGTRIVQTRGPYASRSEALLVKLDSEGHMIWSRTWGVGVENYCWSMASSRGRIYQVGFTQNISGNSDAFLLVYNGDGDLISSRVLGGPYEDYAWGIAVGGDYLYAVGHTLGRGMGDILVMKFDLDGAPLWNMTWGGAGWDLARSVAVDGDSVYVSGLTYSLNSDPQAILLKYRSPNTRSSPLEAAALASLIALGLATWMTLIIIAAQGAGIGPSTLLERRASWIGSGWRLSGDGAARIRTGDLAGPSRAS